MGFTDVSELTEIINATRNEDLRAAVNNILEQLSESRVKWQALVERIRELIKAREDIAEKQALTEGVLLDRVGELAKNTDDADDLLALATAYAHLRDASVAPGQYEPDIRHTDKPKNE
jgi:hypothetical protein